MTSQRAARAQRELRQISSAATRSAVRQYRDVDPQNVTRSWGQRLAGVSLLLAAAQGDAAALSVALFAPFGAEGRLNPSAFAGTASDGNSLEQLLFRPALTTLFALRQGESEGRAVAAGLATLSMIFQTQIADAHRAASTALMTASPEIAGYERVVRAPACDRCIVLAGRLYRWTSRFRRHPRCDCTMDPVTRRQWRDSNPANNPRALFERMSREEQDRRFGKANAEAIRQGADISQVVNSRQGMTTATVGGRRVRATRSGVTRRAVAGRRLSEQFGRNAVRLMPEEILRQAENRADAIRLMRLHGYIL